jgi:hypothetical protein
MATAFTIYALKLYKLLTKANKASPVAANTLLAGCLFSFCFIVESAVTILTPAMPDLFDANSEIMMAVYYGFNLLGLCVLLYLFKNGVSKLNPSFGKSSKDLSSTGSSRSLKHSDDTTGSSATSPSRKKASWWNRNNNTGNTSGRDSSASVSVSVSGTSKRGRMDSLDNNTTTTTAVDNEPEFGSTTTGGKEDSSMNSTTNLTINPSDIEMATQSIKAAVPTWDIAPVSPTIKTRPTTSSDDQSTAAANSNSPPQSPVPASEASQASKSLLVEAGVKKTESSDQPETKTEPAVENKQA